MKYFEKVESLAKRGFDSYRNKPIITDAQVGKDSGPCTRGKDTLNFDVQANKRLPYPEDGHKFKYTGIGVHREIDIQHRIVHFKYVAFHQSNELYKVQGRSSILIF